MTVQTPSLASEFIRRSHHALGRATSAGQFSRPAAHGPERPLLIVSGIRQPSILGALRATAVDDMLYCGICTPGRLLDSEFSPGGAKLNGLPGGRSVMIKEFIEVKKND